MINEFDKEMDSLLRQAARGGGEAVSTDAGVHLDADEVSLFAENTLPVTARARVTGHLADCNRCRKILSGVISLNAEAESEIVHARAAATVPVSIPWSKKLFGFPRIAFAMGALALIFSGIIAFTVLENRRRSQNAAIAQIEEVRERPKNASGASSDGETTSSKTYSISNSSGANMASTSATPPPAVSAMSSNASVNSVAKAGASVSPAKSNAPALRDEKQAAAEKDVSSEFKAAAPQDKPAASSKKEDSVAADAPAPRKDNNYTLDGDEKRPASKPKSEPLQNQAVQNQPTTVTPDSRGVRQLPLKGRAVTRQSLETTSADSVVNEKNKSAAETRAASGKVFKRADNAWYDSAYNGQRTINIRRGTGEYKKLDAGLRSIVENISGAVVVLWKGKAYRIS